MASLEERLEQAALQERLNAAAIPESSQEAELIQGPTGIPATIDRVTRPVRNFADLVQGAVPFGNDAAAAGTVVGQEVREALGGPQAISFSDALGNERQRIQGVRQQSPRAALPAEALGAVGSGLGTVSKLAQTIPGAIRQGGTLGALFGGGSGDTVEDRATRAVLGGVTGGATAGLFQGAGQALANRAARSHIPDQEQLFARATAAYNRADNAGVRVAPPEFAKFTKQLEAELRSEGFRPRLHPRADVALDEIKSVVNQPQSLRDLDQLRRVIRAAARSNEADERRVGSAMIAKLDEFIDDLNPDKIIAGNAREGVEALKEARSLYSRAARADTIDELIDRAGVRAGQFSGSGFENALTTEFRQLRLNPKRLRGFSEEEKKLISAVAEGDNLQRVLRWVGKLAPTSVQSLTLGPGAGFLAGGAPGAAAVPLIGSAGRLAATARRVGAANRALNTARAGGPLNTQLGGPTQAGLRGVQVFGAQGGRLADVPEIRNLRQFAR